MGTEDAKIKLQFFSFKVSPSPVFKPPSFFERRFDNKTRRAFEGCWSLWIYAKCTCALTFPHCEGTAMFQHYVLPIFIFLSWNGLASDSHLKINTDLLLRVWSAQHIWRGSCMSAYLHLLVVACKRESVTNGKEQRVWGSDITPGLMQRAGSGPNPL